MALKASPVAGLFPSLRPTASSSPSTSNRPCSLRVLPLRPSFFGSSSGALRVNVVRLACANRLKCNGHGATMNLFERFSRVVKSYANALISSFEDPEKILEQTVIEMNSDLTKMRQATAQVLASQKQLQNKYKAAQQSSDDWYKRAQLALAKGDEDLAREALKRRKSFSVLFFSHPLKPSFNPHPPPLFSPSPSPSPPSFSPLHRLFSTEQEFPSISSQELIPNDDSSLPVLAVVHFLDGFHDLTGLPWWMIIASSTVAVRLALLPLLILQLKKLKTISELLPQLPMPIPEKPTLKGSIDQFSHFLKESRAVGCPSFLWFFPYLSVQLPCFFLLMASIRKMSLDGHPGFDSGGALWFQNLSELPGGSFGPVFPILIAAFHYINIQISFDSSTIRQTTGLTGLLMRYYKLYLEILSVPLFFVGYAIPQGSLVYWVTNSSVNIFQQLSLKHPTVGAKLGLLSQGASPRVEHSMEISESVIKYVDSDSKEQTLSLQTLTPEELLSLSVQVLSKGDKETSIQLLRLALEKDPGYVRGLVLMGQALLQKTQLSEATEYLELAIAKLLDGTASDAEDVELLMLASQWAGAAYVQQGKTKNGITHLERVAKLKEPGDPKSKEHYFEALLLLSSALYKEGQSDEAAKILRVVVDHNPAYKPLLEQCEDENELVSDLVTRRKDHF